MESLLVSVVLAAALHVAAAPPGAAAPDSTPPAPVAAAPDSTPPAPAAAAHDSTAVAPTAAAHDSAVVQPGAAAGSAVAADSAAGAPAPVVRLPEVVVTAWRGRDPLREVPASAYVFDRAQIGASGASRLSSLLQSLPGLYGYLQNSSGDPAVVDPRGFTANGESSYLKLLVDGQDVRDVENGNVDWDWVLPDDVERVEVVEGPGSWVWGDAAEGGVVNVVRPAPTAGWRSDCAARIGSFGLATGSIVLTGGRDPWAGSARLSARRVDGWRDHSRERVYNPGGELRTRFGPTTRVTLQAAWLDANRQDPGTLTPDQMAENREQSETDTDFTHSRRLVLGGRVAHGREDGPEWALAPYLRTENVDQVRTLFFQTKSHPTEATTGGAELSWHGELGLAGTAVAVNAGSVLERSRLDSRYFDFDSGAEGALRADTRSWRTTGAVFAAAKIPLGATTTARLGFREDGVRVRAEDRLNGGGIPNNTPWSASPLVAVTQRLGARGSVYASYSGAFRVPTLNQLFDQRPFDVPTPGGVITVNISNPDLKPQRTRSLEVGGRVDGSGGGWATWSAYDIQVRDEIDFDGIRYDNIGRSRHLGVEGAASVPLESGFAARASGAWTPTQIQGGAEDGNQINAVPIATGYAGLQWTRAARWSVECGLRSVGRQFLDKANGHPLPAFTVVDLATGARLGRLHGTLKVGNLLDRKYADTGYFLDLTGDERLSPAAGRSVTLMLTAD
jgi:outer membrane receptor protein involved in Fe transport